MKKFDRYLRMLLITLLPFISCGIHAQSIFGTQASFTPNRVFDSVFDQFGNAYQLSEIAVNDTLRSYNDSISHLTVSTYSSGYFKLYLDRNCGMENYATDTNHLARLKVVCQVLQDVSQFINSPCSTTEQPINIWCRDISLLPNLPADRLGVVTSFYNIPLVAGVSGIADNTFWKTLNAGVDAYNNIGVPYNNEFARGISYFHGMFAFDFNAAGINWNTSLTSIPDASPNSFDLYTEVLHQVVHALGFSSLISSTGNSLLGATHPFYSRYDTHLKTSSGTNLLSHSGSTGMYNYSFGVSTSVLAPGGTCYTDSTICSTAIKYYGGLTHPQAVYTPNCFEPGVSLSHFEDACLPTGSSAPMANNQYFLMSNKTNAGDIAGNLKRFLQPEERQVLYDLGYSVNDYYGNPLNMYLNYISYDTTYPAGGQVAGIADGLDNGAYSLRFDTAGTLTFTGNDLIGNDIGTAGGSFEGLQLVSGTGTFSATSGSAGTTITLTGASAGVSVLSYVPVSSTGVRGNISYGSLNKTSGVCNTNTCNLIPNPGFESASGCGQLTPPATASYSCWQNMMGSADLFSTGCTYTLPTSTSTFHFAIPDVNCSPAVNAPPPLNGSTTNNEFVALGAVYEQNATTLLYAPEGIEVALAAPLVGGTTYYGTLWAKVANNSLSGSFYPAGVNFNFVDLPSILDIGLSNSSLVNLAPPFFFTIPTTFTRLNKNFQIPAPTNAWTPITFTITPPVGTSYQNFIIYNAIDKFIPTFGNIYPTDAYGVTRIASYILVDNVRLTTDYIPTFTPPTSVHVCDAPLTNLAQYISNYSSVSGGTFGGPGVTQASNGTFTPSAITGALPTTVTISYTYTDVCGTNTIYANIKVTNSPTNISATPNPICLGNSVTLSTTSCTTCTWAANGTNFCTACSSSQTATVTGYTTYSVAPTGSNCAASVTVAPIVSDITLTGPGRICAGTSPTALNATLSDPGYSYTWKVSYDNGATWSNYASGTGLTSITPTITTPGICEFEVIVNTGSCTVTSSPVFLLIESLPAATLTGSPLTICDNPGAYVTLNAGPAGMHYSYDNGATTTNAQINISSPTGSSTHTVTVTDGNGCSATSSPVTVTLNLPPSISAIAAPTSVCTGQPVSLTALGSGAASVSWTPATGSNAVACATCTPTTAHPTASTLYTVVATASNGCTTTAHVQVTVSSAPSITITASATTIYAGQSVILTASGGGASYTWTPTTPAYYSITSSQSSISVTPSATTTYTVTSGTSGCTSTAYITITVIQPGKNGTSCVASTVFAGHPYHSPALSSGTFTSATMASNTNYIVTGTIHLSGAMTINSSNYWIGPNVTIYVDDNAFVQFNNCHFFTCLANQDMWNGFAFAGTRGSMYLTGGTLIEDANVAITVNGLLPATGNAGHYIIKSDGATINRCITGIDVKNYTAASYASGTLPGYFNITNTVFTSRNLMQYNNNSTLAPLSYPLAWPPLSGTNGLKTAVTPTNAYTPPYNLVLPTAFEGLYPYASTTVKSLTTPRYGILMNNMGYSSGCNMAGQTYVEPVIGDGTNTTNKNIFDGFGTGISMYNSNLSCVNNVFMNMAYQTPTIPGDGIYTNASGFCDRVRVWNGTGSLQNEFYDCVNAVDAPNISEFTGQNAKIISSSHNTTYIPYNTLKGSFGYNIRSYGFYNLDISNNYIYNVTNGIFASAAGPTILTTGAPPVNNGPMNISNNHILASAGSGVSNPCVLQAINVQNLLNCTFCKLTTNANVNSNTITGAYNGININSFLRQQVTGNFNTVIMAQQSGYPAQYGIKATANFTPTFNSDSVAGTSYTDGNWWGIYTEKNTNMTLSCNGVGNVGRAFEFRGTQTNTRWTNNRMTNSGMGMVLNSGTIGVQVPYAGGSATGNVAADNEWLVAPATSFSWTGTNYHTSVYNADPSQSQLFINSVGGIYLPTNNFGTPFADKYSLTPSPPSVPLPSLIYTSSTVPNCSGKLSPLPFQPFAPFVTVAQAQAAYYSGYAINAWMDQMALWQMVRSDSTLIDSSATVSAFATLAAGSRLKSLTDIEDTLQTGAYDDALIMISAMPAASPATDPTTGAVLADSAAADYIVANYTNYYSLYIKFAEGSATATDTGNLLTLANLCPLTNGAIVFQARALYDAATDNPQVWVDDDACGLPHDAAEERYSQSTGAGAVPRAGNKQYYSLYPNPNNGSMALLQTLIDIRPVAADVWDAVGRKVYSGDLHFTNHATEVELGSVAPGLYIMQLKDGAGSNYMIKFTVEK